MVSAPPNALTSIVSVVSTFIVTLPTSRESTTLRSERVGGDLVGARGSLWDAKLVHMRRFSVSARRMLAEQTQFALAKTTTCGFARMNSIGCSPMENGGGPGVLERWRRQAGQRAGGPDRIGEQAGMVIGPTPPAPA
jgi:hypothetical protein